MKQGETRIPGHRFRLPKIGLRASCFRDGPGMVQGWFRDSSRWLGRGDRPCRLDDWAPPVLHRRHADPKRLGSAGARGMKLSLHHTILLLQFGLTRPITEDHHGDCTDQGVSVLTLFIPFHHKSSSPLFSLSSLPSTHHFPLPNHLSLSFFDRTSTHFFQV